ncbi:hypothetical protein RHECNPAF_1330043 [Rhizobium etli CNPAF512]|nr:hypothetical protein RHECNPAF_1330043 [Rhizobium etli CNPAF512]
MSGKFLDLRNAAVFRPVNSRIDFRVRSDILDDLGAIGVDAHHADEHVDLSGHELRNTVRARYRNIGRFDAELLRHQLAEVNIVALVLSARVDEAEGRLIGHDAEGDCALLLDFIERCRASLTDMRGTGKGDGKGKAAEGEESTTSESALLVKHLCSPLLVLIGISFSASVPNSLICLPAERHPLFEMSAQEGKWPAQREIDRADHSEDDQRLESVIRYDLPGAGEFGKADDRDERGSLNESDEEADRRRKRDLKCLGQNHVEHAVAVRQAEGSRRFGLAKRHCLDASPPDFAEKRTAVGGQSDRGSDPCADVESDQSNAIIEHEELHQERRSLEHLDVQICEPAWKRVGTGSHQSDHHTDYAAACKRNSRKKNRPLQPFHEHPKVIYGNFSDHGLTSFSRIGEVEPAKEPKERRDADGQCQVDSCDDEIDFEATEGLRFNDLRRIGQFGRRDRSDNARGQHQKDELSGETGIDRTNGWLQNNVEEDLASVQAQGFAGFDLAVRQAVDPTAKNLGYIGRRIDSQRRDCCERNRKFQADGGQPKKDEEQLDEEWSIANDLDEHSRCYANGRDIAPTHKHHKDAQNERQNT